MKGKRGLSGVITTLILILLGIVLVGVIWVVVNSIFDDSVGGIDLASSKVKLEIQRVTLNNNNTIDVNVKRNVGEGEFEKLNFVVGDGENSLVFKKDANLKEFEQRTFTLDYNGFVKEISVAPIFISEKGEEKFAEPVAMVETKFDYFDDMNSVGDWEAYKLEGVVANSYTLVAANGVAEFSIPFDEGINEYQAVIKSFTPFKPEADKRYVEIKYKMRGSLDQSHFEFWPLTTTVCGGTVGWFPRQPLQESTEWQVVRFDLQKIINDESSCTYDGTQEIGNFSFIIDDDPGSCCTPAETFYLDIDYIKLGQSFS